MNETNEESLKFFTDWLDGYLNFEKTPQKNIFWLDTMKFLCERLGNPEKEYPCFHVAGSKGKGSISAMIAGILNEKGLKVGVYSSPHILDFKERIKCFDKEFDAEIYIKSAWELMSAVNSIPIEEYPMQRPVTWFELVTLFAMICFKNAKVDFAVWEVGLGGRLDATNVVNPICCCIGPIELEHTDFLGNTIEKIAAEKAGIIKESVPVISSPQKEAVKEVFANIAGNKKSPIHFVNEKDISNIVYKNIQKNLASVNYDTDKSLVSILLNAKISSKLFKRDLDISLQMLGDIQVQNALVASCAVKTVFPEIEESIIESGLSKVTLPARFEVFACKEFKDIPHVVLDGAHTLNSISFTLSTYRKIFSNDSSLKPNLLFACAADKDIEDIAGCFAGIFENIVLTRPGKVKQSDIGRAEKAFAKNKLSYNLIEDYDKAIEFSFASSNETKHPLLITGSFYLIAEVKKYLGHL